MNRVTPKGCVEPTRWADDPKAKDKRGKPLQVAVAWCGKRVFAGERCEDHGCKTATQWDFDQLDEQKKPTPVAWCGRETVAHGRCATHYQQLRRYEAAQTHRHPDDPQRPRTDDAKQIGTRLDEEYRAILQSIVEGREIREEPGASMYQLCQDILQTFAQKYARGEVDLQWLTNFRA